MKRALLFLLSILFSSHVLAECELIPSDYALYSSNAINILDSPISVNGHAITTGNYSPKAAIDIDGTLSTNQDLTLPALNPASFPANSSTTDKISNGSIPINETSEAYYRTIRTKKNNRTITFTGGGPIHIETLQTDLEDSTINFAAGTYYINNLIFKEVNTTINVTSGPVIIHVGNSYSHAKKDTEVNKGGNIDDFIVYLHSGSIFSVGEENFDFTGILYGPDVGGVSFNEKNVSIHGLIAIGGGEITIAKEDFSLTLTDTDIADVDALGSCDSVVDHFELSYASNGLTCTASAIELKACSNADCSALYTDDVTISLSPSSGWPSNPITLSNGNATLDFNHTIAETVTLAISSSSSPVTNALQCFKDSLSDPSCSISFSDSGFVFDVPTLTACKPSADVTIRAVKKSDDAVQCVGSLTGSQAVKFWSTYSSPTTGTNPVKINGSAITTSSTGTAISLNFDSDGEANFTAQYDDAGQLQLDAHFTSLAGVDFAGDDTFVSQPLTLITYSDESAAQCASADANCSKFKKAGEHFDLKVKAACWTDDADTDFTDNPATPNFELAALSVTNSVVAPSAGSSADLAISSFNFLSSDNGIHIIEQSVSEVGVFSVITTPTLSYFGSSITSQASTIGRFYPDHFVASTVTNGQFQDSCSTFSYSGQAFTYQTKPELKLTAHNLAADITQNYTGDFAKITASDFTVTSPIADALTIGADGVNLVRLTWNQENVTLTDNADGSLNFSFGLDTYRYYHEANSLIAPFNSMVNLAFTAITDSDGVQTPILPTLQPAGTQIRFGRLTIDSAHGSELVPLTVDSRAEYFNGVNWVNNTADQCTTLAFSSSLRLIDASGSQISNVNIIPIDEGTSSATLTNNNPFNNGKATLTFSAPGEDNLGYVDIQSLLAASNDWLLGDFDNDGSYDDDASGRASFGLFKGHDNIIFRQELY